MATPLLRLAIMRPPSSGPNRTALARVKINAPAAAPASRSRSGKSVSASCASARRRGGPARPLIGNEWWLPPRSLRLALRVARPPRSAKRAPLWLRGLRRPPPARPAKVAGLALAAPPFQVGAWLRGGSFRFRRLRAAGERHPSWVSRAHPSLPLRRIYHFIDSLKRA